MGVAVRAVTDYIEEIAPRSVTTIDYGAFHHGNPDTPCTGVAVTWTPSVAVLREAAARQMNLVVSHEFLYFPHSPSSWWHNQARSMAKPVNLSRMRVLEQHGMCVYTIHAPIDFSPQWGIVDAFGRALGFGEPLAKDSALALYELAQAQPLDELAQNVKTTMGLPAVRVAGEANRGIRKVVTAVGGLGQIYGIAEGAAALGADCIVFGEAVDYAFRCAVDAGLAVIETAHHASESFGLRNLAGLIGERFPDLLVEYIDAGVPYRVV